MTIEGEIIEAGELSKYEMLPQKKMWIAVYKYGEGDFHWMVMYSMEKNELLKMMHTSKCVHHSVKIYSVPLED